MYIIYVKMYVNICICIHNMKGPVTPASMQHITWIINENSFCMVLRVFSRKHHAQNQSVLIPLM